MILEYQVRSVGHEKLRAVMRSIDQEADRSARRGEQREARVRRQRDVTARAATKAAASEQRANARLIAQKERDEARARTRKEREESRSRQRREREEQRAADRIRRYEQRQYAGVLAHRNRMADKARREEERSAKRVQTARRQTAGRIRQGAGRVFGNTAGAIGTGVRTLGTLGILGGSLAVGNAVGTQASEQALATQLANQASDKADPALRDKLLKESQGVRGFTGGEVLGGLGEFVAKTGDLDAARGIIGSLGELSLATGADLGDLGATAGQAFNVLADEIKDPQERLKQLKALMAALAQQGAMGAVEIRDLASDFGKLGAATRAFEGGAPDLLRTMGAFAQIAVARGGAVSSADASTAASRLAADMVGDKKSKFEKILGKGALQSKSDKTKLRDPLEIMLDVLDKTGGDIMKTGNLFGQESAKIFRGLAATYSSADGSKKDKRAAVEAEFAKFASAEMSEEDIRAKADLRASDSDIQFKDAMKEFNAELGGKLLPELTKLIPKLAELTPIIGDVAEKGIQMAEWLSENPYEGLAVIVGGFMLKELAAVGFSALFERAIMGAMGSGAGGAAGEAIGGAAGGAAAGKGKGKGGMFGKGGRMGRFLKGATGTLAGSAVAAGSFVGGLAIANTIAAIGAREEGEKTGKKLHGSSEGAQLEAALATAGGPGAGIPGLGFAAMAAMPSPTAADPSKKPGGDPKPDKKEIDVAKFESIAKDMKQSSLTNLEAAQLWKQAAESQPMGYDPARTTPILYRP